VCTWSLPSDCRIGQRLRVNCDPGLGSHSRRGISVICGGFRLPTFIRWLVWGLGADNHVCWPFVFCEFTSHTTQGSGALLFLGGTFTVSLEIFARVDPSISFVVAVQPNTRGRGHRPYPCHPIPAYSYLLALHSSPSTFLCFLYLFL
jgi:hypothetical protein